MIIDYTPVKNTSWTFEDDNVREYVEKHAEGKVLNLYAGMTKLDIDEVRVDSNNTRVADYYMTDEKFLDNAVESRWQFDTVIFDPPWDDRKSKEKYDGHYVGKFTKVKPKIAYIIPVGGIVISAGYYISNFGHIRGFEPERLLVCNPFGEIRPFFISIERKYKMVDLETMMMDNPQKDIMEMFA